MPYRWIDSEGPAAPQELHLWPHQSLPPQGFVLFIGVTLGMLALPLSALLGTVLLWGLLPFLLAAVGGIWFAIHRNRKSAHVLEVLTLSEAQAHLVRHNPDGRLQEWDCNRYWATAQMHDAGGPVPHYVTLRGGGREVEIGAFLSEDERVELYHELNRALRQPAA